MADPIIPSAPGKAGSFQDAANLIAGSDVPDGATKVDNTNPIIAGGNQFPPDNNQELDKQLRNLGVSNPTRDTFEVVADPKAGREGDPGARVVARDPDGNETTELFRGDLGRARGIADRANKAQERIKGAAPQQEEGPRRPELLENPTDSLESTIKAIGDTTDNRPVFDVPVDSAAADVEPSPTTATRDATADPQNVPTGEGEGSPLMDLIEALGGGGGAAQAAGNEGGAGEGPTGKGTPGIASVPAQGAEDVQVGDLVGEGDTLPEPVGPNSDIPQTEEYDYDTEGRVGGAVRQIGEILQKPRVREGMAQLAQIVSDPEGSVFPVAKRQEQRAAQEARAQELGKLLSGEIDTSDVSSPEVVTASEDVKTKRTRRELLESRIQKNKIKTQQALAESLNEGEEMPDVDTAAIGKAMDVVSGKYASRLRSGDVSAASENAAGIINQLGRLGKNVDFATVSAALPDEARAEMQSEIASRVAQSTKMTEEQARSLVGSVDQKVDTEAATDTNEERGADTEGPEGLNEEEMQTLQSGGNLTLDEPRTIQGKTLPAGSYTVRNGEIMRLKN